ncbi:MAG: hypothetical protein AB7V13_02835 [Pseudorhodoplanes sp.]|uniref:hypothetical protein n=1 Tax=Pseudorhodoplanes sp. TaxID=1934341 RepID=UPI003D0AC715
MIKNEPHATECELHIEVWADRIVMHQFPTSYENIALNLIFEWLGESRYNRSSEEYGTIAARIPSLDACHAYVNQRLQEFKLNGTRPFDGICRFKAGDKIVRFEEFPESMSRETVRTALVVSGMSTLKRIRRSTH